MTLGSVYQRCLSKMFKGISKKVTFGQDMKATRKSHFKKREVDVKTPLCHPAPRRGYHVPDISEKFSEVSVWLQPNVYAN